MLFRLIVVLIICLPACVLQAKSKKPAASGDSAGVRTRTIQLPRENKINALAYEGYSNGLLLIGLGEPYAAIDNLKRAEKADPQSFEISLALAELYYSLKDPSMALKELDRTGTRNAAYYRLAAACYQNLGDLDKAVDAAVNLAKLAPDDQTPYSFLATVYRQRQDLDSCIWAYENLARLAPDNARVWNELGQLRLRTQAFDQAKVAFQRSISADSSSANIIAFAALSDLYSIAQMPESSKVILKEALALDSTNMLLHRQLTSIYAEQDSFALALPHAVMAAQLSPLDRNNLRRLGWVYLNLDSLAKADSIFTNLIENGEDLPINRYYLGHIALQEHDYARARDQFGRLVAMEDTLAGRWIDLGYAQRMLGHADSELVTYREGLQHVTADSGKVRLKFAIGAALERGGQVDSAIAVLEDVVASAPNDAEALNYLGYLLADKNLRLNYARDLIKRALDIEPNNAAFLDSYGWVFYRLKDYDKATEYLSRAASLSRDATIFEHLGDVYSAQGKTAEARQWWQKALDISPQNAGLTAKLKQ